MEWLLKFVGFKSVKLNRSKSVKLIGLDCLKSLNRPKVHVHNFIRARIKKVPCLNLGTALSVTTKNGLQYSSRLLMALRPPI